MLAPSISQQSTCVLPQAASNILQQTADSGEGVDNVNFVQRCSTNACQHGSSRGLQSSGRISGRPGGSVIGVHLPNEACAHPYSAHVLSSPSGRMDAGLSWESET